jgi:hypothetical protein
MKRRFLQSALAIASIAALPRSDGRRASAARPAVPAALFITDQAEVTVSGALLMRLPSTVFFNVREHWPATWWSNAPLQVAALLTDANALLLLESLRHRNLRLYYAGSARAAALHHWQQLHCSTASLPPPAAGRQWLIFSIGATTATHEV